MNITDSTPQADLNIKGHGFTLPEPFSEGHQCSAGDAATLNQTFRENCRNNFAKKVADEVEAAEKDERQPDMSGIQGQIDEWAIKYEFGVGRGPQTADPVKRRALEIAKVRIRAAYKAQNKSLADVSTADLNAAAAAALDKYPAIMELAKQQIEAENSIEI